MCLGQYIRQLAINLHVHLSMSCFERELQLLFVSASLVTAPAFGFQSRCFAEYSIVDSTFLLLMMFGKAVLSHVALLGGISIILIATRLDKGPVFGEFLVRKSGDQIDIGYMFV